MFCCAGKDMLVNWKELLSWTLGQRYHEFSSPLRARCKCFDFFFCNVSSTHPNYMCSIILTVSSVNIMINNQCTWSYFKCHHFFLQESIVHSSIWEKNKALLLYQRVSTETVVCEIILKTDYFWQGIWYKKSFNSG